MCLYLVYRDLTATPLVFQQSVTPLPDEAPLALQGEDVPILPNVEGPVPLMRSKGKRKARA